MAEASEPTCVPVLVQSDTCTLLALY